MSTQKRRKRRRTKKQRRKKKKRTRKKKNFINEKCAPKGDGQTLEYSCYTSQALHNLKEVWNARHPDVKIKTNNTRLIWEKLRELMSSSCNKESCWLKHKCLKEGVEKSIINNTFAPLQPISWKRKPTEWLSSVDIQKVMKQWENAYKCFEFMGPTPIDFDSHKLYGECVWEELCKFNLLETIKKGKTKIGIIFNTHTHDKPGEHWIGLFINTRKKEIIFMDSYGDKPPKEINVFAKRVQDQSEKFGERYTYDKITMRHQYSNSECGMYCLYFIIEQVKGRNWRYFDKTKISDKKMKKLRKIYFNVNN